MPEVHKLLKGSSYEQAYFLYLNALENGWVLLVRLQEQFRNKAYTIKGFVNSNLARIASEIDKV